MPGYFTDDSMIRRIHREHVVGLSGARSLLMQAAHPVAFTGFFMSTGDLDDPYARLQRTARVLDTIVWGERVDADEVTAAVRPGSFPPGRRGRPTTLHSYSGSLRRLLTLANSSLAATCAA
jgi:hypothetical protein